MSLAQSKQLSEEQWKESTCYCKNSNLIISIAVMKCINFPRILKNHSFLPVINKPPLGKRELPLVYLQRREKPVHMTWERWYQYTNEKFIVKQQAEIKQEELKHKQREDEEKMANALTMDFFSDENLSFNGNGMALM